MHANGRAVLGRQGEWKTDATGKWFYVFDRVGPPLPIFFVGATQPGPTIFPTAQGYPFSTKPIWQLRVARVLDANYLYARERTGRIGPIDKIPHWVSPCQTISIPHRVGPPHRRLGQAPTRIDSNGRKWNPHSQTPP